MLQEGLSLAAIGRRVGRHESTVAYWLDRHGLRAVHAGLHSSRGAPDKALLEALAAEGLSTAEIGRRLERSKTTVRHWLKEYGIRTVWASRKTASEAGIRSLELVCDRHGATMFFRRPDGGYRCLRCRAEAVSKRRRAMKRILVEEAGGRCSVCGYDRCVAALEFHHLDPSEKRFALSHRGVARSLAKARAEASKCVLVCSNCHAEIEAGMTTLGHDRVA
jgi:transposase